MKNMFSLAQLNGVRQDIGFVRCRAFYLDIKFIIAVLAGAVVVFVIHQFASKLFVPRYVPDAIIIFNVLLWYPLLEETLFRGVIQGQLRKKKWALATVLNLTVANWMTSVLFAGFHFFYHPPLAALLILIPSLVFGYFRDLYKSILPSLALHSIYNLLFLLLLLKYGW
jgi:hypothetical protein